MSENEAKPATTGTTGSDFTSVLEQKNPEPARPEISGTAIARMMGVATSTELKLLEGKLDLISGRINHLGVKVDKIISQFQGIPTGSDMERIDVQIGSVKSILRDLAVLISGEPAKAQPKSASQAKPKATEIVEAATEDKAAPAE
jgi:hypothetical protein